MATTEAAWLVVNCVGWHGSCVRGDEGVQGFDCVRGFKCVQKMFVQSLVRSKFSSLKDV